ncbi:MAG: 5-formyltetrahydrofolate cyclo-ligase [Clostridium sp.]|nr:5-formyltetrahydrofolate cyclo-ligase [Clostridium sp.]
MGKQQLRRYIRTEKNRHTMDERLKESATLWCLLEADARFQKAHTVLAYHALPDEVQTAELFKRWNPTKRFILPVVTGDDLELRIYQDETQLRNGAFGIQEPIGNSFTTYEEIDLALIPGVAFDKEGHRLGRGKGYYDRLLTRLRPYGIPTLGICYGYQKVNHVPTEPHDIPMDDIL